MICGRNSCLEKFFISGIFVRDVTKWSIGVKFYKTLPSSMRTMKSKDNKRQEGKVMVWSFFVILWFLQRVCASNLRIAQ
jgi:hypothetical protein